jgi:DNA-binding GntR family transcriptional regulator
MALTADIAAGRYPVGSRLPPERELARLFGTSRPTVREALSGLETAGLVEVRRGSGAYVLTQAPPVGPDQTPTHAAQRVPVRTGTLSSAGPIDAEALAELSQISNALLSWIERYRPSTASDARRRVTT